VTPDLLAIVGRVFGDDEQEDPEPDFYTSRNECRECGNPVENPEEAPTELEPNGSALLELVDAERPTATFCSEQCRRNWVVLRDAD